MQESKDNGHKVVYLVNWKTQKNHVEIFDNLNVFAASYPKYDLSVLNDALAFGKTVFENEDVRIEKKAVVSDAKPGFPRMFFRDFNYDLIDWHGSFVTVIQRILERGSTEHWTELVRFYGKETIIDALKEKITFLPDECIEEASLFFNLNKEDMLCYKRKQSQKIPWL